MDVWTFWPLGMTVPSKRLWILGASTTVAPLAFMALQIIFSDRVGHAGRFSKYFLNVAPLVLLVSIAFSGLALFMGLSLATLRQHSHPGVSHAVIGGALLAFLGGIFAFAGGGGSGSFLVIAIFGLAGAIWSLPVAVALELTKGNAV